MEKKFISPKEVFQNKESILMDVRTPEEFNENHIKNSQNIPLDQIPNNIEQISKINKNVILICKSGNRAKIAQEYLQQNKINSQVMLGGIIEWENKNYHLE